MRAMTVFLVLMSMSATGQVVVNGGRTFLGPLDASNASRTQPFRTGGGANRPASCLQGEVYFQTDAPAGQNLQFCTAANVWTAMSVGAGGGGTVTSIGLALPAELSVTGSPVTSAGTVTAGWATQAAKSVLMAPNGSAGTPSFRALVASDIPALSYGNLTNTGASAVSAIPRYTSTDGTAVAPSTATVDGGGNMAVPGTITTGGASSGSMTLSGAASGAAKITVAAAAGSPADLVLPTATGVSGQVLQTNGGTPQQLSWATPASGEITSVTNSGASGAGVLKTGTNVTARRLVAGSNVTITENTDDITIAATGGGSGTSVTTKGDLQTHDGTTATRLAAGTNTYVLTADSTAPNGIKWAAPAGGAETGVAEIAAGAKAWWWPFGYPQAAAANGVSAVLRTHFAAFTLPVKISVAALGFRIHTAAASASAGVTIGIYNATCNTLLLSGNKSSGLNTAGYYKVTVTPTVLNPGNYYMAWASDDGTMAFSGTGLGTPMVSYSLQMGTGNETFFYGTASTGAGAAVTLPASCGTRGTPSSHGIPHFVMIP